jgi:hypothetical protein
VALASPPALEVHGRLSDSNFAENERGGFWVSRGEPLVISIAHLFLIAEKQSFSAMLADSQKSPVTLLPTPTKLSKSPPLAL